MLVPFSVRPVEVMFQLWMLYYYVSLALRENILRVNGSNIKTWWIVHHYLSIAIAFCMLMFPPVRSVSGSGGGRVLIHCGDRRKWTSSVGLSWRLAFANVSSRISSIATSPVRPPPLLRRSWLESSL
jgi:hypothetical protein